MSDDEKLLEKIIKLVGELEWGVILPVNTEEDNVPGLIIGDQNFLDLISGLLEEKKTNDPIDDEEDLDDTTFH